MKRNYTLLAKVFNFESTFFNLNSSILFIIPVKNTWTSSILLLFLYGQVYSQNLLSLHRAAWHSSSADFFHTAHLTTDGDSNNSFWESQKGSKYKTEWIYIDLGKVFSVNQVIIHWGKTYGNTYHLQIAAEAPIPTTWQTIYSSDKGKGKQESCSFPEIQSRFIRLLVNKKSAKGGLIIREMEIFGKGQRMKAVEKEVSGWDEGGRYLLDGAWYLQKATSKSLPPEQIASFGVSTADWLPATVPGTVLSTYIDNGAIPDPNYSDWQLQISETFSYNSYWYRTAFSVSDTLQGKKTWLHFNGINYRAEVYINGKKIETLERCFLRHQLDISSHILYDQPNTLAVLTHPVETPGKVSVQSYEKIGRNGGKLGLDNPTFHFSVGWDWNPTVRGRNIGIWDEVFLSHSGPVTIHDPFVVTDLPLPDTNRVDLNIRAFLENHLAKDVQGMLKVTIPGITSFSLPIQLNAGKKKEVQITAAEFHQLKINDPQLWWPNGYGQAFLHTLQLEFLYENHRSDLKTIRFGIREIAYQFDETNDLQLQVNGHPILIRGGNWGSNDINIRFDKKRYETQVRLHQEMNFNMIRNWVGQTGHECFYDYCDQYGILVWDDFWLANGWDGPDPRDKVLFMQNARDKISKLRHHPSVAVWCARNETNPPFDLEQQLKEATEVLDGTRMFIRHSRAAPAKTSSGPWHLLGSPESYYEKAGSFLTELGLPCVPPIESMRRMMPEEDLWPINSKWGLHDFGRGAMKADTYTKAICNRYGDPVDIEDYCKKAQLVNWVNYKALFEGVGQLTGDPNNGGVILWMSQPTWPSMVWQTYDYFFEPTGAYFGSKLACEPVHIQRDAEHKAAYVVNITQDLLTDLEAMVWLYNMNGTLVFQDSSLLEVSPFSTKLAISYPDENRLPLLSPVHFVKMQLRKAGKVISQNFYWRSSGGQDYRAMEELPAVKLNGSFQKQPSGDDHFFQLKLSNLTPHIALAIRIKIHNSVTGQPVLPAIYSDNYFSLVPGEARTIKLEVAASDFPENGQIIVEGWNIRSFVLQERQNDKE